RASFRWLIDSGGAGADHGIEETGAGGRACRSVAGLNGFRRSEGADQHSRGADEQDGGSESGGGAKKKRRHGVLPANLPPSERLPRGTGLLPGNGDAEAQGEIGGRLCGAELGERGLHGAPGVKFATALRAGVEMSDDLLHGDAGEGAIEVGREAFAS